MSTALCRASTPGVGSGPGCTPSSANLRIRSPARSFCVRFAVSRSRWASIIAPSAAVISSAEETSKAHTYLVNSSESDASTPTSISTNKNSIRIAPVYTMICTANRNGASNAAYWIARQIITVASISAQCTALRASSMPSAASTITGASIQNATAAPDT